MAVIVEGNNAKLTGKDLAEYMIKRFPDKFEGLDVRAVTKILREEARNKELKKAGKLNEGGLVTKNYVNPVTVVDNRKKK
tara:strand:+ start:449 stop:688 length:240 start_codon:yes stop_codon:yes gene_type:complete